MPRVARSAVMGLDLSTRASAAIVLPRNWAGDWTMMRSLVFGSALEKTATVRDRALRTESIAEAVVQFGNDYGVRHVWIEGYAFSRVSASTHILAELGGVVKLELVRAGMQVQIANMGTARKLLLGRVPRGKGAAKKGALKALRAAGMPFRSGKDTWNDEADAFVAANFGMSELGGHCFAQYFLGK